jgi:ribosomal protein S27E
MPRIRFIRVRCPHCGVEYKVRLDRIEDRQPFECLACGGPVAVEQYVGVLKLLREYSALVVELENAFTLDGDIAVPLPRAEKGPALY